VGLDQSLVEKGLGLSQGDTQKADSSSGGLSEANIEWAKQNTDNPDPSKAAKAQTILDKVRIKNNPAPVRANR